VKAAMPGRVVRVLVSEGETVEAGQGLVVLEAMKMQNEITANRAGVVRRLSAVEGATVTAGALLCSLE
jgi:acetyl-CoA/propionyl-CoA carboxylase biotin carboxyl carrier protein